MWTSNYKPGVYLGISIEDYHLDPAISSSQIKYLLNSPREYWYHSWMNPQRPEREVTAAMKFGTAYHTLMLEPERFCYTIKPGKTTTVDGCLAQAEFDKLQAMKAAIEESPYHTAIISGGYPEVSVFWIDEETGIPCKCRFDYWKTKWVTDLKTTTDVSLGSLRYSINDWGYDVSGGMYMTGTDMLRQMIGSGQAHIDPDIKKAFIDEFMNSETRFVFLMQEKEPPFLARAQAITEPVAQCGKDKFRTGLRTAQDVFTRYGTKKWPTGFDKIEDMMIENLSPAINYI